MPISACGKEQESPVEANTISHNVPISACGKEQGSQVEAISIGQSSSQSASQPVTQSADQSNSSESELRQGELSDKGQWQPTGLLESQCVANTINQGAAISDSGKGQEWQLSGPLVSQVISLVATFSACGKMQKSQVEANLISLRESIPCGVDPAYVPESHEVHLTANEYAFICRYMWSEHALGTGPEYEVACALHDLHCQFCKAARGAQAVTQDNRSGRNRRKRRN